MTSRSAHLVTMDLDPIEGWGHEAEDHQRWLQHYLETAAPHYKPEVRPMVWVYIVGDIEGERREVFVDEGDAGRRVDELEARLGIGFAHYDRVTLLMSGTERPEHPLHGV